MSFELAHLKFHTRQAAAKARKELLRDCNFDPFARIVRDPEHVVHIPFKGEWMTTGRRKDMLFFVLGELCRRTNAPGLVIVSDGWALEHTPAQLKRMDADPEYLAEFERISRNDGGLPAAAAAGFGDLVEAIVCSGQTRDHAYGIYQHYQRVAADGLIPAMLAVGTDANLPRHRIRLRAEREISAGPGEGAGGRMFSLFEHGEDDAVPADVAAFVSKLFNEFEADFTSTKAQKES